MIDLFLLLIYLSFAAMIFLLVYGGLYFASWQDKPNETTDETADETPQEAKPKRTLGQWVVTVLLVVSGILAWGSFLLLHGFSLYLLIFALPLATFILFVIFLIRYIRVKRKQKRYPEEVSPEEVKFRKTCLIVFAALLAVALAVVLCILFIPSGDVAYM